MSSTKEQSKREEKNATRRAYNQANREKIIANQDKKAIQRAYEASNKILQEERKAYRESSRSKKSVTPPQKPADRSTPVIL